METTDIYKFSKVQMIINDDCKILDFLADLQDREPIKGMDNFLKWGDGGFLALYYDCPLDGMCILLLYKSPFDSKKSDDKWILYYTKDIRSMYKYFKSWLNVNIEFQDEITAALSQITHLLIEVWADLSHDEKSPRLTIGSE